MFSVIYKKIFLVITALIFVFSFASIAFLGLRFGLDFTGGSLLEIRVPTTVTTTDVEAIIQAQDFGSFSVRTGSVTEDSKTYLIRTRDLTDAEKNQLLTALFEFESKVTIERFTSVGPVVGAELQQKSLWAIGGISLIIVLYVAYTFAGIGTPVSSWIYGLITIFVLVHDILVPTALMAVLGMLMGAEIDVLFVMALLAVLGYSVNDTIVIFDRVRENLKANRTEHRKKVKEVGGLEQEVVTYTLTKPFPEIVGSAVQQSLARSINTSLTTMVVLATLFLLGGSLTQIFALILFAGVLAGTYSSICIASPLLVAYYEWQERKQARNTN